MTEFDFHNKIVPHYEALKKSGCISPFEFFKRLFLVNQEYAMSLNPVDHLIYLDLLTALRGTTIKSKNVKLIHRAWITNKSGAIKFEVTISIQCSFQDFKILQDNLHNSKYIRNIEYQWNDELDEQGFACVCVLKFIS